MLTHDFSGYKLIITKYPALFHEEKIYKNLKM